MKTRKKKVFVSGENWEKNGGSMVKRVKRAGLSRKMKGSQRY